MAVVVVDNVAAIVVAAVVAVAVREIADAKYSDFGVADNEKRTVEGVVNMDVKGTVRGELVDVFAVGWAQLVDYTNVNVVQSSSPSPSSPVASHRSNPNRFFDQSG